MKSNKILIVGGGSAGWMTAATLIKAFPDRDITVLESPNYPTVGVGESTIGKVKQWTKFLDIDDKEFLKHTDGIIKYSIGFTNFNGVDKGGPNQAQFHYPFGDIDEKLIFYLSHGFFIGIASWLLTLGPRYLSSPEVSLLVLLETVFAPILVWLVIGEFPGHLAIIGGSLIIVTLFIFNLFKLLKENNSVYKY